MTVIRPNSVSGITSITAQANEINFFRSNGTLAGLQLNGVNFNTTTGVSTFNNLDVGGVLTYQDVTNVDSIGIITARSGINVTGGNIYVGSGKIGLGIQSPARELHLHSPDSGSTYLALTNTTSGSGINDGFHIGLGGDEIARIWNYENTNLEIGTNNGKRLEINTVGVITQYSTGSFQIAKGNTSERPNPAQVGMVRFNTETDQLENYNSTGWVNVNVKTPTITSITGNIYNGLATNLTINGNDFDATVTVIFKEGSTTRGTLTNQSVSSGSVTVSVPSGVYNQSAGDTITITVTNIDGVVSTGSDKTIQTSPSGGTITTSGNFRIHTFTSSGNFVNTVANLGVEYLVIAGGGGGGSAGSGVAGGGGGAGGYRSNVSGQSSGGGNSAESAMTLSAATYAVVVGAGAAKPSNNADQGGVRGSNSSFNSIVSTGGGGGGGNSNASAQRDGGSGGGGQESNGAGGSGTSGQGYDGGDGSEGGNAGGGGGGAGEAGNTDGFAHGGDGVSSNITGSAVVRGGGGSSGNTQGLQPPGGDGGGAQASTNNQVDGGDGTANTGGGGGGGYSTGGKGGAGGSGIVIVRYNTTTIS